MCFNLMHFIGSERSLNVWYEIQGITNRQDALEAMIVFFPIVDIPPKPQLHAAHAPCVEGTWDGGAEAQ